MPCAVSAHIDPDVRQTLADAVPEEAGPLGPAGTLAWHAAAQAWERSGLPRRLETERGGVFLACNRMVMEPAELPAWPPISTSRAARWTWTATSTRAGPTRGATSTSSRTPPPCAWPTTSARPVSWRPMPTPAPPAVWRSAAPTATSAAARWTWRSPAAPRA
ncbi:hypothetical protein [Streptomyces sirii]|uniref:hypothetical protein n=1 Tax=Streptomyces sirii TaxID=3127701 RepID=UPI003D366E73